MDAVEIIILAAAAVGLVAFVVLAVLIIRQGRVLKDLEERVGPPVPPAAAPSLERVRAVSAASAPATAVAAEKPQAPAPTTPAAADQPDAPRQTARQAAQAREQAKQEERQRKEREKADRATAAAGSGAAAGAEDESVSSGRGLVMGAIAIVIIGLIAAGGWYLFIRDDGSGASTPVAQSSTTATTTTDSGEIPDDVPPLANKAAYTVAVLNASNVTGAAANKVAPRVQADGYTLGVVDNATSQDVTASEVQYVKGRQEVGWNLAKDLGITKAVEVNALAKGRIGTADAVVIVGKDLAG